MDATDDQLARRAAGGDAAAFAALFDRHYDDALRYATRLLDSRADAEDAVQDTFVRAFRALDGYDERQRFRAWLWRILVNRCRTVAAQRTSRLRGLVQWRAEEARSGSPSPDANGDLPRIEAALALLPTEQREAFLLKHMEEFTYEEMAALTGEGESALKMRVKRARDRLRELLPELKP